MARAGVDTAAVVMAATELADAEGFVQLTLTRLAERLGVRPPSLYAHIGGLDDLRRRLGAHGNRELARALSQAIEGRSGHDALRALATAYRDFAREHPGLYDALQRSQDLANDEEARAAGDDVVRAALAGLRAYDLDDAEVIHAVRLLRISLHGFVTLEAAGGFAMPLSADETFARLLSLLDLGLREQVGLARRKVPTTSTPRTSGRRRRSS